MTYWEKGWDLYICRYIISTKKIDRTDKGDLLVEKSYYTQIEMFKSDNPEDAYDYAMSMIPSLSHGYRNDEGQEVQDECLGINDLDLLQENISSIESILNMKDSFTVDTFSGKQMRKKPEDMIQKKENLTLFDKYYNYQTKHNKK